MSISDRRWRPHSSRSSQTSSQRRRSPVAIDVIRALGIDAYVILQKSPELHLANAPEQRISSITSNGEQHLLLDRAAVSLSKGKRVVVVNDVMVSGSSMKGLAGPRTQDGRGGGRHRGEPEGGGRLQADDPLVHSLPRNWRSLLVASLTAQQLRRSAPGLQQGQHDR
ncbi:hypothetical protein [Rhizobium tumorigenes]|uniref:Uncharacterized protein n=1 Tax=Rhizobium tumorigenes TaxID=2041385 RepID=A0AAF1KAZ9_9HYPH|nr:hypothetical protein [Rhizobium tumorigenes]WFR98789.1 hypothetical protein PR017_24125 [Rhizobium tumorigenes]